jgi:tRNA-2-methylthio-N6-dimethylallyladenosine synthase
VVTRAAPHYLIADGAPLAVRRTRGGDAWQARHEVPAAGPSSALAPDSSGCAPAVPGGVLLGMPAVGRPG